MTEPLRYEDPEFFYGNLGDEAVNEELVNAITIHVPEFHDALVAGYNLNDQVSLNRDTRDCRTGHLDLENCSFIQYGMTKIVENVNDIIWKRDLKHEWENALNVMQYNKPGHHFKWHNDADEAQQAERSLTLVYSLTGSQDHTGGEFSFRRDNGTEITFRFERGDFIVFPCHKYHKVHPLKTGTRTTIVGWYR